MSLNLNIPSPVERIKYDLFNQKGVFVYVKRDDLIHPVISGNKWRKLKLNIERYKNGQYEGIISFGGAYSNHISALAALGKELNIPTIGIIRGEELNEHSNETLIQASSDGMKLVFVNREEYGWRYELDYKNQLRIRFGNYLVIEEGGSNYYGVLGCTEIIGEVDIPVDYYAIATGTGTTTSGLILGAKSEKIIGIPVFKNGGFIREDIRELLIFVGLDEVTLEEKMSQLTLETDYHFGGYGRFNAELIEFINEFYKETGLKLDQIYTGKMFYALCALIKSDKIKRGSTVIAVHTGGLQGTNSIKDQLDF